MVRQRGDSSGIPFLAPPSLLPSTRSHRMSRRTNRRQFLQQTGLAGIGFWAAGGVALADSKSPNEKLNIACIGVSGKGSSDASQAANHGNIVAICDIDDNFVGKKANDPKFAKARK